MTNLVGHSTAEKRGLAYLLTLNPDFPNNYGGTVFNTVCRKSGRTTGLHKISHRRSDFL